MSKVARAIVEVSVIKYALSCVSTLTLERNVLMIAKLLQVKLLILSNKVKI
jgi:hypothetical protein